MIRSFGDSDTEAVWTGARQRRLPAEIVSRGARKLDLINAAASLDDLRATPGNRLHKLKGDKSNYHAIRVNDQWRIVFIWMGGDAFAVSCVDYH